VVCDLKHIGRNGDGLQTDACIKTVVHDLGDVLGQDNFAQIRASRESVSANSSHGIRNNDVLQALAVLENRLLDGGKSIRKSDTLHAVIALEKMERQLGDAFGNGNALEVVAIGESILAEILNGVGGSIGSVFKSRRIGNKHRAIIREQNFVDNLEVLVFIADGERSQASASTEGTFGHGLQSVR